jgi:hypothetical protein
MSYLRGPSMPPYAHFSAGTVKFTNKDEILLVPSEDHPCSLARTYMQVRPTSRPRRRSNMHPQRTIRAALRALLTRTSVQVRKVHDQGRYPVSSLRGSSVPPYVHFNAGEGKYTNKEEIQRAPSEDPPCGLRALQCR